MGEVPLYWLECSHMAAPRGVADYRGTSLIRNSAPLAPYCRAMPRALWWS